MSTGASQRDTGEPGGEVAPLAPDRPYVDGATASPEELRAEVEKLRDEDRQHVDELREEVGDSVAELAARFDVKSRVTEKKDEAVANVHEQVGRARAAAAEGAGTALSNPGPLFGALAALVLLLVVVLRRRRRA
jgi:hypothetical protein